MRAMSKEQIKKAISNVNATLAVEGLEPSQSAIDFGEKYFKNEITIEDAIKMTTEKILLKKEQTIKS